MSQEQTPPVAPVVPHSITAHGDTRIDEYFWMRDRTNPDVIAYIEAENAYLEAAMAHTKTLQEQLYQEMRGRIQEEDASVPAQRGAYFYYSRVEQGHEYGVACRTHGADGPEQVLLDQNLLAEGQSYCRVGNFEISPDQNLLAYSVDFGGDESYTLRFKDLATGETLADAVPGIYYGLAWASDNRTVFYTVLDEAKRPFKLFRHTLGTSAEEDTLVYHEADDAFFLEIYRTHSGAFLVLQSASNTTSEVRVLPSDRPEGAWQVVAPRQQGVEYHVEHHGNRLLITTNEQAQNFRLLEAPLDRPGREHWRELLPHNTDVLLEGVSAFANHLVLYERAAGLQRLRIATPDFASIREIAMPEPVYTVHLGTNYEYETSTLRLVYSSLVTPESVVDYGMDDAGWLVRKQEQIPSGYEPANYTSERLMATARDGTKVPISLVYRTGLQRDGNNPMLLYGYGSYGITIEPSFASARLSLLDRGFVYAIAHIRGGSELGRAWYENGKLLHKENTFTDFIACAEYLMKRGYTSPERLGINGRSAGGLLMGAVTNMRPDLFRAVIAGVPFVDVLSTMSDPTLPLTVTEYEEWGNPEDPVFYELMRSYSPYDNVEATAYPHMLITSGLNDPRVSYWEPTKWAARLRVRKTNDTLVLLKTNMDFGHFGASGRFDHLYEEALEYAFLIETLGTR